MNQKIVFLFRKLEENQFTWPVLLNQLENSDFSDQLIIRGYASASDIGNILTEYPKSIVIFAYSFMTIHVPMIRYEVTQIRAQVSGSSIFIAGGPHATGDPEQTLKLGFDYIFIGDGEWTLRQFLQKLLEGNERSIEQLIKPDLPFFLDDSSPVSIHGTFIPPLEITRGCSYRCKFCQTGTLKPRHRSLASVKEHLKRLQQAGKHSRSGYICPSAFQYEPDDSNQKESPVETLLKLSKSAGICHLEYGIFPSEVNPKTVNNAFLELITKYCSNKRITIGAQAGTDQMLKSLNRSHTVQDVENATHLIHQHGLRPQLDFIFGFPHETAQDRHQTLAWIKHLHHTYDARIQMHYFTPLAGSLYANEKSSPLDSETIASLNEFYNAGICTDWWKTGIEQTEILWNVLQELKQR